MSGSRTASTSFSASATVTPTASAAGSSSASASASVSVTATSSTSATASMTQSTSLSASATASVSQPASATATVTSSLSSGASSSRTASPSWSVTATVTVSGSASATVTASVSQTASTSASQTASSSGSSSVTSSPSVTISITPSNTASRTPSKSPSISRTGSGTAGASVTRTVSISLTPTTIPSESASASQTATATVTRTAQSSLASSRSSSASRSPTRSVSQSGTATVSPSLSSSASGSNSLSMSSSASASVTPSVTPTISDSPSSGASSSSSTSPTVSASLSASSSGSPSSSQTPSNTPSSSSSATNTPSSSNTPSASPIVCLPSCGACVDDFTCTTCKSPYASLVAGVNGGPCACNVGYYGNNATCTVCDDSCNSAVGCRGPGSASCNGCNEAQQYTLDVLGEHCQLLPCPTGLYNDDSGGSGHHQCAVYGIVLTCFNPPCYTTEDNSASAKLNVALSRKPSSNVRVSLVTSNTLISALTASTIDLTPQTYQQGVNVTVNGVQDYYVRGTVLYTVTAAVTFSQDGRYYPTAASQSVEVVSLTVDGSESYPFQYVQLSSTLYESRGTATFLIAMTFDPLNSQTGLIGISGSVTNVVASPSSIQFTTYNWLVPQTVTLSAPRNFVDEGNTTFNATLTLQSSLRTMLIPFAYVEADRAGVTALPAGAASLYTTQVGGDDGTAYLSLALASRPLASVAVTVVVSPTTEAALVGPSVFTFDSSSWSTPQRAVISGVHTLPDSDVDFDVPFAVTVSSAAAATGTFVNQYAGRTWNTLTGANGHLVFPVVSTLTPALSALLGGWNMTVGGSRIMEGCTVNVTQGSYSVPARYQRVDVDAQTIFFTTPEGSGLGYASVVLTNPDGGYGSISTLYYTDDCPVVGQFGHGKTCVACPTGAYCPGGTRMWPLQGYWAPSETAGYVVACPAPPSRCPAWNVTDQTCGVGYAGARCSQCATGYYLYSDECVACGSESVITLLLIVDAVFIAILTTLMLVLPSGALRAVVLVVSALQGIRAVGQMASTRLPAGLLAIYQYLALTSIDISFLRSSCTSFGSGYFVVFWGNLLLMLACMLPLVLVSISLSVLHWSRRQYYLNRLVRGLTVYASMFYLVICTRAFQAIYCTNDGGGPYVLVFDYSTPCFSGEQLGVTAAGYTLLVCIVLGYPLGITGYLYSLKSKGKLDDNNVLERFGYLYGGFRRQRLFFTAMGEMELLLLALAAAIGTSVPNVQAALSALAFGVTTLMLMGLRPYIRPFDNAMAALAAVCGLCGVVYNYISSWGSSTSAESIQAVGGALVAAVFVTAFLVFLYLYRSGHLPPVPSALALRFPVLKNINKHTAKVEPEKSNDVLLDEKDATKNEKAPATSKAAAAAAAAEAEEVKEEVQEEEKKFEEGTSETVWTNRPIDEQEQQRVDAYADEPTPHSKRLRATAPTSLLSMSLPLPPVRSSPVMSPRSPQDEPSQPSLRPLPLIRARGRTPRGEMPPVPTVRATMPNSLPPPPVPPVTRQPTDPDQLLREMPPGFKPPAPVAAEPRRAPQLPLRRNRTLTPSPGSSASSKKGSHKS